MASDKVLELRTSARLKCHLHMRNQVFLGSLEGAAFGTILKQGMWDYWNAIEAREVSKFETMAFLFSSIKAWWRDYLEAHRAYAQPPPPAPQPSEPEGGVQFGAIDWSATGPDAFSTGEATAIESSIHSNLGSGPAEPTGALEELFPSTYPDYHEFAATWDEPASPGPTGPRGLYRLAACVALNEMENSPYEDRNDTEFAARVARVLLNETPQRVLASLATPAGGATTDPLHHWPMSLLLDVDLDDESDRRRTLMTGGFEFLGRQRAAGSDAAATRNQQAKAGESEKTLAELARTSALQIDCFCSTAAGTDMAGKAKSLYDLEVRLQADTSNLLSFPNEPMALRSGPILGYARVFGIAVWPVRSAGFSLDQALPAGKDQTATSGLSRGLSGSHSYSESSTESSSGTIGDNVGFFGPTATGGVSASISWGSSSTVGSSESDSWSKNLSVSVPHVDFVNYRIESREGAIAPLIVFSLLPPFLPDLNAPRVLGFCKDLVQKRMDLSLTPEQLLSGEGAGLYFDDTAELGEIQLQRPSEASVETFQQSCVFSFSRDDERVGPLRVGMRIPFRVQFIVGIGQVGASAQSRQGRENVFLRDFTFDLRVEVPGERVTE